MLDLDQSQRYFDGILSFTVVVVVMFWSISICISLPAALMVMEPAKRSFPSRGTATTETALMTRGFSQLYLSLGDPNPDGSLAVRLYYKPLVLLIWLGAVVMVIGGALSLSDRRLRVGAPKPARSKPALSPAE